MPSVETAESKGNRILRRCLTTVAVVATLLVLYTAQSAVGLMFRQTGPSAAKIGLIENVLQLPATTGFRDHGKAWTKLTILAGLLLAAAAALGWSMSQVEYITPPNLLSGVKLALLVLCFLTLALFAVRLKVEFFLPSRRFDWMMNGFAFASGIVTSFFLYARRT